MLQMQTLELHVYFAFLSTSLVARKVLLYNWINFIEIDFLYYHNFKSGWLELLTSIYCTYQVEQSLEISVEDGIVLSVLAKTKALISCAITAQQICIFVFRICTIVRFLTTRHIYKNIIMILGLL